MACPPRFGTPRNPDRYTLGPELAEVSRCLGRTPMPHQQHIYDVGYELDDNGQLYYDEIVVVLSRQEGKSIIKVVGSVHRLTVLSRRLATPQRATFTMQHRQKAKIKLERDYSELLRRSSAWFREIRSSRGRPQHLTDWKPSMNNGSEHIQFGPSNYWQIDAPTRTGGHGDTLNRADIDEAFAHGDDTIEEGLTPSMATSPGAQLWIYSAAGDRQSRYLWRKVIAGRAMVAAGSQGRTAYFEFSAPEDADPGDPATWAMACPALGFTIDERFLESQWKKALQGGQEKIDQFKRSYLSMWPEVPLLAEEVSFPVVPADDWWTIENEASLPGQRVVYTLDGDTNARGELWFSIGASDGVHLEDVTPRGIDSLTGMSIGPGGDWVVPALVARRRLIGELLVDPDGPAGQFISELEEKGIRVRKLNRADVVEASERFLAWVVGWQLQHLGQAGLNAAAAGAQKRATKDGRWFFSRVDSIAGIGPLMAVMFSAWAARTTGAGAAPAAANTSKSTQGDDDMLRPRERLAGGGGRLGR